MADEPLTRVLLVEDDSFFALRVTEYLTDNGIPSYTVRSTQEALSLDLNEFAAAIIDVMLPNDPATSGIPSEEARGGYLAGIALTRRFKGRIRDFPVILLSSEIAGGEARRWAKENGHSFVSKFEDRSRLLTALAKLGLARTVERPRSFIVHGHDEALLLEMKDYIQNVLNWPRPVVLREQPSCGKTIIEKFEALVDDVDLVFVLLTPDDEMASSSAGSDRSRRARQNVILELGFFLGKLQRLSGKIILLYKGSLDIPSDISGIIYIDITNGIDAVGEQIRKEIAARLLSDQSAAL